MKYLIIAFIFINNSYALTVKERMDKLTLRDFSDGIAYCMNSGAIPKPSKKKVFRFHEYAKKIVNSNNVEAIDCVELKLIEIKDYRSKIPARRTLLRESLKRMRIRNCEEMSDGLLKDLCVIGRGV